MSKIEIKQANDEFSIKKCFPVVVELRPHLIEESFYEQALNQFKEGYQLWYLKAANNFVSIIGFRIQLARPRFTFELIVGRQNAIERRFLRIFE